MTGRRRDPAPPVPGPTHAQRYRDAVWDANEDELTPVEALILMTYANHARGTSRAWVASRRLMQQAKIRSESTVVRLRRQLVDKGWLLPAGTVSVRGGRVIVYELIIPDESAAMNAPLSPEESAAMIAAGYPESAAIDGRKRCDDRSKALRSSSESAAMIGGNSLDSRDSLVPESQRAAYAAASLRAAASANGQPAGTLSIEDAKRQIRETLKGARRVELWRWPRDVPPRPGDRPPPPGDPPPAAPTSTEGTDPA